MRLPSTLRALPLGALFVASLVSADEPLIVEVTKAVECSRKTQNGDYISVHYNGTLEADGSQFDTSYGRATPFSFKLGLGRVIEGWDKGLLDMCIGERRKLTIPAGLGYGESGSGPIPGGSTLVFSTELMGIDGVVPDSKPAPAPAPARPTLPPKVEPAPARPTVVRPEDPSNTESQESQAATDATSVTETPQEPTTDAPAEAVPDSEKEKPTAADSPMETTKDAECHLLGSYALFVQGALGLMAVTVLVFKRWRESPRRPLKIWFFDVSKQVVGSAMLHLANVLMSMLSSGRFDVAATTAPMDDGDQPNPCSWYLLNITIDTTIGIPILVILLKLLHRAFLLTPLANPPESIRSGNYGQPPRAMWWLKQSLIYFLGLMGMKLCVFFLFKLLPWIAWVGDWALRWTEGNEAIQITFVMFIFPLIMNALQYWIIDGFIKDRESIGGGGYGAVDVDESFDEEEGLSDDEQWLERHRERRGLDGDDSDDENPLREANPLPVPVRGDPGKPREYDPETDRG